MILVSTPGTWEAGYWPLEHATWDGWTPTDLVFPFLLFAMGAAVPFAMARRRGTERRRCHRNFTNDVCHVLKVLATVTLSASGSHKRRYENRYESM